MTIPDPTAVPDPKAIPDHGTARSSPWMMRTYSGHSTARASNELYRRNLEKGQTGLSIAFDLPTQTGYDPDAPEAAGEVGKVGVPVAHLGHMRELMAGIPVGRMNTSMTINATAPWLLGLYIAHATEQGVAPAELQGTTQNDIVKEYLSRGTFIFPPQPSLRLTVDTIAYTVAHVPKWNPVNVCSYHLQEAGATPVQEVAYALSTAIGILDAVRDSGKVAAADLPQVVGRISFFVNSGVQVNSLGLTEQQPENNVARIVLETLGVTLSASARARAIQLPAWNEALGLPRPWDQQWSLRIQQILAYESDLLEYPDIFNGSKVVEEKTAALVDAAAAELDEVLALGGAFEAIEELKTRLVRSQAERLRRIESGEQKVVGVNCSTETEPSPLTAGSGTGAVLKADPAAERELCDDVRAWRAARDAAAVRRALDELRRAAEDPGANVLPATVTLALAGGTTGEWAGTLRDVFGEYRAPTGVTGASRGALRGRRARGPAPVPAASQHGSARGGEAAAAVRAFVDAHGGPPRLLVAKPGLDGHSNGAEQVALAARDAGFEVIYQGIRLSPAEIAAAARDEDVDVVGLSVLSGSHLELVPEVLDLLRAGGTDAAVVVGGIVPEDDAEVLRAKGVAAVYTPKDFELDRIVAELVALAEARR